MAGDSAIENIAARRDSTDLSYDTMFDLLSHKYRRISLVCLAANDQLLTLDTLALEIADYEHETDTTEISPDALQQIEIQLVHTHLPRLAAAGVLTYDRDHDLIQGTEHLDQLQDALSCLTDTQID